MRNKRTHKAVKRPDLSRLKEALQDNRVWCGLGIVLESTGPGSHFEIDDGDVLVDVELQPSEEEITAIVSSPVGGLGVGVFAVPPVGAEVIVAMPDGEMVFSPTIVGVLNSGPGVAGLSDSTIVIVAPTAGQVLIHDGDGTTDQLVTKTAYEAHTHPTGVGPSGPADNSAVPTSYTQVLEAK